MRLVIRKSQMAFTFDAPVHLVGGQGSSHRGSKRAPGKRIEPPSAPARVGVFRSKIADKLRRLADGMDSQIEEKLNPAISHQNVTARRSRIAGGMYEQGRYLQRVQEGLRALASAREELRLPSSLANVETRAQVENLIQGHYGGDVHVWSTIARDALKQAKTLEGYDEGKRLLEAAVKEMPDGRVWRTNDMHEIGALEAVCQAVTKIPGLDRWDRSDAERILEQVRRAKQYLSMGVRNQDQWEIACAELRTLLAPPKKEDETARKIREAEAALIGNKIPGFFSTPRSVVSRLIEYADIQPGMTVLEPSAGKGNIADALRAAHPDADLSVGEYQYSLRNILGLKGFNLVSEDFLQHEGQYDRIVQNPPFEKGQDVDHVLHAYALLAPGGVLVSVMGEHPFFAGDKKSVAFREWVDQHGVEVHDVDAGAFLESDMGKSTGVSTKIIVAYKPEASEVREERAAYGPLTVIYQDRNAGGGWYRVFSAAPASSIPQNWNAVDAKLQATYEAWVKHGGMGKWAVQAREWKAVARDPQAAYDRVLAEQKRYRESQEADREQARRLESDRASGKFGITVEQARKLKKGDKFEVAGRDGLFTFAELYQHERDPEPTVYAWYPGEPRTEAPSGAGALSDIRIVPKTAKKSGLALGIPLSKGVSIGPGGMPYHLEGGQGSSHAGSKHSQGARMNPPTQQVARAPQAPPLPGGLGVQPHYLPKGEFHASLPIVQEDGKPKFGGDLAGHKDVRRAIEIASKHHGKTDSVADLQAVRHKAHEHLVRGAIHHGLMSPHEALREHGAHYPNMEKWHEFKAASEFKEEHKQTPHDTPAVVEAREEQDKIPSTHEINTPERQRLRENIFHALLGKYQPAQERQAYIVLGPSAAGKSTVANPIAKSTQSRVIDSDDAKEMLPEFHGGKYAGAVHEESSDIGVRVLDKAIESGDNMVLPYVGRNADKIRKISDRLKEEGYTVHLRMVDLPAEKAAKRAVDRFRTTGRFVDPAYVLSQGTGPMDTFRTLRDEGGHASYEAYSTDVQPGQAPKFLEEESRPRRGMGGQVHRNARQAGEGSKEVAKSLWLGLRKSQMGLPFHLEGGSGSSHKGSKRGPGKRASVARSTAAPRRIDMPSRKIKKILEVKDTRQYEEVDDGIFEPIPGSGDEHPCSRCGRIHVIHATVELDDGTHAVVGTGCMKADDMEMAKRFEKLDRAAKRLAQLKAERDKRNADWDRYLDAKEKVSALEKPQVETVDITKEGQTDYKDLEYRMGDAYVWDRIPTYANLRYPPSPAEFERNRKESYESRMRTLADNWEERRIKEMGAKQPLYPRDSLDKEIQKVEARMQAIMDEEQDGEAKKSLVIGIPIRKSGAKRTAFHDLAETKEGYKQVRDFGTKLGLDWKTTEFNVFDLARGMDVESEHDDVTHGDPEETARIALAHLKERSDYYTRLAKYVEKSLAGPRLVICKANRSEFAHKLHYQTRFQGIRVSIENRKGSIRRGKDKGGKEWETKMHYAYGRIPYSEGTDGDCVDVYLGPHKKSDRVFIVHQNNPTTGKYDEDKVMAGFNSAKEAKAAYLKQYDNPKFFGSMTELSIDEFKDRLKSKKGEKLSKALADEHGPTLVVDVDGVIYHVLQRYEPKVWGKLIDGAKEFLQRHKEAGCHIVLFTARGSEERRALLERLDEDGLGDYIDEVRCGKPIAVAYIDDRAISFRDDWDDVDSQVKKLMSKSLGAVVCGGDGCSLEKSVAVEFADDGEIYLSVGGLE